MRAQRRNCEAFVWVAGIAACTVILGDAFYLLEGLFILCAGAAACMMNWRGSETPRPVTERR